MNLTGFHHLTAITADARANYSFYTGTLGMRLVKKTVNQDDVSAYHLFYADRQGSPGSDLTFFDWPTLPERRGNGSVGRVGLRVPESSLSWWKQRLDQRAKNVGPITEDDGRSTLDFEDGEGQRLRLVGEEDEATAHPWEKSPVPSEHQIRGLGPVVISVPSLEPTADFLCEVLNCKAIGTTGGNQHIFQTRDGGSETELHIVVEPGLPQARQGAGGVHHVAFRTPDTGEQQKWAERLRRFRVPSSSLIDRFYFQSLYFNEPGGVLFEIATDGPGFTADEPIDSLGERLSLPPFLEEKREKIEAGLRPLT